MRRAMSSRAPSDADDVTEFNPVIIAEAVTSLKRFSVSEAVMELDLTVPRS